MPKWNIYVDSMPCPYCGGTGRPQRDGDKYCRHCNGMGEIYVRVNTEDFEKSKLSKDKDKKNK